MAKSSAARTTRRAISKRVGKTAPPILDPDSTRDGAEIETPPPAPDPQQMVTVLSAQLGFARNSFFRLAQVRGADRVKYEGISLEEASQYAQAELRGFDEGLARAVPQ
jgi:hypothetical protein